MALVRRFDGLDSLPAIPKEEERKKPHTVRSVKRLKFLVARLKRDLKREAQVSKLLSEIHNLETELDDLRSRNAR